MIFSIGFNYKEDPLSFARPMLSIFEDLCGKLLNQAYPQLLYLEFLCMNSLWLHFFFKPTLSKNLN